MRDYEFGYRNGSRKMDGGVIMEKDETKDTLTKEGGDLCIDGVAIQGNRGRRWQIKLHTTFRLFKSRETVLLKIESEECCGSGSAWIRIKLKGRIRIRIKIRIQIRINLKMTIQNVWNMSLFEHFAKVLSLYWKQGSGSVSGAASK